MATTAQVKKQGYTVKVRHTVTDGSGKRTKRWTWEYPENTTEPGEQADSWNLAMDNFQKQIAEWGRHHSTIRYADLLTVVEFITNAVEGFDRKITIKNY